MFVSLNLLLLTSPWPWSILFPEPSESFSNSLMGHIRGPTLFCIPKVRWGHYGVSNESFLSENIWVFQQGSPAQRSCKLDLLSALPLAHSTCQISLYLPRLWIFLIYYMYLWDFAPPGPSYISKWTTTEALDIRQQVLTEPEHQIKQSDLFI